MSLPRVGRGADGGVKGRDENSGARRENVGETQATLVILLPYVVEL